MSEKKKKIPQWAKDLAKERDALKKNWKPNKKKSNWEGIKKSGRIIGKSVKLPFSGIESIAKKDWQPIMTSVYDLMNEKYKHGGGKIKASKAYKGVGTIFTGRD